MDAWLTCSTSSFMIIDPTCIDFARSDVKWRSEWRSPLLTSSWTASTFGLLPVRRRPEPGPLLATVASDLDLWWVFLDGDTKTSPSTDTGLSGAGLAAEKEWEESALLLWCLLGQWRWDGEDTGLSETETDLGASHDITEGLSSSDRMSFRSLVPLE